MAQLDRFLSVMVGNGADAIELHEGSAGMMMKDGKGQPFTRQPLGAQTLVGLVREIATGEAARALDAGAAATFDYATADGAFTVRAVPQEGRWHATIVPAAAAATIATPATNGAVAANGNGQGNGNGNATVKPATPPSAARVGALSAAEEVSKGEIDTLLRTLHAKGASDLHLRVGEPPILRLHGEMHRLEGHAPLERERLEAMLRAIMPERNATEYTETSDSDYAYEIPGVARFRANALRDRKGPAAVFRVIPAKVVTVEEMQVTPEVQALCMLTKGLVLVTGPTGSGKSTTLCSLIDLVNRTRNDHVITIEDPIEFVHENKRCIITQRQVGVHTTSFKSALRAALREDPDIILVGELRDLETISIAIETAETGHLVFGTLHTTTAAGTVDRIIDQFPADRQEQIRVMLAESLKGVVSQTLCRKKGGGRVAAREILLSTPAVSSLIREGKTFQIPSVMQTGKRLGMVTLNDALIDVVDRDLVEPKEAYMKAVDKANFVQMLKGRGHDTSFVQPEAAPTPPQSPAPAGNAAAKAPGGRR
jgi:twitching motility protein PilT